MQELGKDRSTDDSLNKRTKYRTTIIIVLVVSCLVALAVALTVVFVLAKPRNEKQGIEKYRFENADIILFENLSTSI